MAVSKKLLHGNYWYHWNWKVRVYLGKDCFSMNFWSGSLGFANCGQMSLIWVHQPSCRQLTFILILSDSFLTSFFLHLNNDIGQKDIGGFISSRGLDMFVQLIAVSNSWFQSKLLSYFSISTGVRVG